MRSRNSSYASDQDPRSKAALASSSSTARSATRVLLPLERRWPDCLQPRRLAPRGTAQARGNDRDHPHDAGVGVTRRRSHHRWQALWLHRDDLGSETVWSDGLRGRAGGRKMSNKPSTCEKPHKRISAGSRPPISAELRDLIPRWGGRTPIADTIRLRASSPSSESGFRPRRSPQFPRPLGPEGSRWARGVPKETP